MFTKPEDLLLSQPYFKIIRVTEEFYEIQSVNTGHYWVVKKKSSGGGAVLYHKHSINDQYNHKQSELQSIKMIINTIKLHDSYVLTNKLL